MRKLNVVVEKSTPAELEDLERFRPKTRADCIDMPRPCPFVSCRHNTYLDLVGSSIHTAFDVEVEDLPPGVSNCVLDYEGGVSEEVAGRAMGTTKQVVSMAMERIVSKVSRYRGDKRPKIDDLVGRFLDPLARKQRI